MTSLQHDEIISISSEIDGRLTDEMESISSSDETSPII